MNTSVTMRKFIPFFIVAALIGFPVAAYATPTSWDFASGILQPLISQVAALVKANNFQATSTTQASTFPFASTTVASANTLCLSTDCRTVWPSTGSPGGLNLQVQYNNAGSFGGISGAVTNGTILNLTNPLIGGGTLTTSTVNGVTLITGGSATSYLNGTGAYSVPTGTTYTATYPVTLTGSAFGLAFGTTTSNTWGGTQTFTNSPVFSMLGAGTVNSTAAGTLYNTSTSTPTITGPITYSGTLGSFIGGIAGAFNCLVASGSQAGCLSSTDWNTFNGKQAAGNYITALTGDVTASGPGSVAATLATVNGNVGSFTNANITVNGKGLITAASNGAASGTGTVSTSSSETSGYFPRWTSTNGTPALLAGTSNLFQSVGGGVGVNTLVPAASFDVMGTTSDATSQIADFWKANGATALRIRSDGNVGIGTTTPFTQLTVGDSLILPSLYKGAVGANIAPHVLSEFTNTSAAGSSAYANVMVDTLSNASVSGGSTIGISNNIADAATVSANQPSLSGIQNNIAHFGSGTVASIQGESMNARNASVGTTAGLLVGLNAVVLNTGVGATTTQEFAVMGSLTNTGAFGLIGDGRSFSAVISNSNANATMTKAAGLYVDNLTNTGTIATTTGVYIGNLTAGTQTNHPYALYSNDSNAWTYLAGSLGIGTSTPGSLFSVQNSANFTTGTSTFYGNGLQAPDFCTATKCLSSVAGTATITLSGDVSGSGTTAITTTIGALKVLGTMIANAAVDLTTKVTGILPVANGGTNIASYTTGDLLYASGSGTLSKLAVGTAGQVLGVVSGLPAWVATSTAGGGAVSSVSNSDGTLTISPTTGAVVASIALAHANTWTGVQTFTAPNNGDGIIITDTGGTGYHGIEYIASGGGQAWQLIQAGSANPAGSGTFELYDQSHGLHAFDVKAFNSTVVNFGIGTTTPFASLSVSGSGSATVPLFAVASTTSQGLPNFEIDPTGHIVTSGSKPTLSSCGSTNNISGNDIDGSIVFTGTLVTTCTMTFAVPVPAGQTLGCIVSDNSTAGFSGVTATSTTAVTFGISTGLASGAFFYHCQRWQ